MSLKALADKVLARDTLGTKCGTDIHNLSHSSSTRIWDSGTELSPDVVADFEERAAILEYSCGWSRADAELQALKEIKPRKETH